MKNIQQAVIDGKLNPYELLDLWRESPLSREDIESFQFKEGRYTLTATDSVKTYELNTNKYLYVLYKKDGESNVGITKLYNKKPIIYRNGRIIFSGTIKNKSELRKILIQTGIK